ncbi:MAG: 2-C-methyl-D-erythritol 4-phosphate cytidylyltransferase [Vulcanimicrobiaceae bacterium]
MTRWAAIVVAAGRGARFGGPKQLAPLGGFPLVAWSVRTFADMSEIERIVVVTEREWLEQMRDAILAATDSAIPIEFVEGGRTRQESVRAGLAAVTGCDAVLVHDGARPLVRAADVRVAMSHVRPGCGAILASPAVDTVKVVDPATRVVRETPDRQNLWMAQTPQMATYDDFTRAHEDARTSGVEATDDAMLLERIGIAVVAVPATGENFKITTPEDLLRASVLPGVARATARRPG